MTAAASTTDALLAEIGTGTAAELAMGVGFNTSPPGPTFIPELDNLILSARPHHGGSSLQRGDLVELVGASGSGKTTVATFVLMTTLLPPFLDLDGPSVPLGGRRMCAALLAPPSHPPPVPFLASTMRAHVERCFAAAEASVQLPHIRSTAVQSAITFVVEDALARLTLLRPRPRAAQWAMALRRLLAPSPSPAVGEAPAVVVCEGLGDGFWPERWSEEEGGTRRAPPGGVRTAEEASMKDVWDAISAVRSQLGAVVLVTVQGLRPVPNSPFYKEHLPPPFPAPFGPRKDDEVPEKNKWPLNIQLTLLGLARVLQMPAETMLVDALRGRSAKDLRVYNAIVRVPGGIGAVGTATGGRCSFGVHEHGLVPFSAPE